MIKQASHWTWLNKHHLQAFISNHFHMATIVMLLEKIFMDSNQLEDYGLALVYLPMVLVGCQKDFSMG